MSEDNIATNSSPFITESYPPIAKNQGVNYAAVNNLRKALRSEPMKVNCPYCNNYDFTRVRKSEYFFVFKVLICITILQCILNTILSNIM